MRGTAAGRFATGVPERSGAPSALRSSLVRAILATGRLGEAVETIETHMSWVFFVGEQVFKLKKPVRFPFLDFSTLAAREAACREEVRLNQRLAPGVYLGVMALQQHEGGFTLVPEAEAAAGSTVDWLVRMRRLPRDLMLDQAMASGRVEPAAIDALVTVLVAFYLGARRIVPEPREHLARWQRELAADREVLLQPRLGLVGAAAALERLDQALLRCREALQARLAHPGLVDGHGDLRPEHVCLLDPPLVIDCIEFNAALREVDPFDELASLALDCGLAGAPWVGERLVAGCTAALPGPPPPALMQLYTARRALLRARLAAAHLLDPHPRTPGRWAPQAQRYIDRSLLALDALDALSPAPRHCIP